MSIMDTVFPAKVKFDGIKIDMHKGEDISPVLCQDQYVEFRLKERIPKKKHTMILNVPAGFDIETTGTDKGAFMYKWQMVFGEYLISGRTWDEWCYLMEAIQRAYKFRIETIGRGRKQHKVVHTFILWIANQGYEFQFMYRRKWNGGHIVGVDDRTGAMDVFADRMRSPLKTMLTFDGSETGIITVYDALKFSHSLGQLAKDYGLTKKAKKTLPDGTVVSDLDYTIKRVVATKLNFEEESYCDADVAILYEWAHYYLEAYVRQNHIAPMTSTGIIRYAVTESYDAWMEGRNTRAEYEHTFSLHPEFTEYMRVIEHLYRGGFTYANRSKAGKVLTDVQGMDYTSSYPACMLQESYPCTEFAHRNISTEEELSRYEGKAWYADFEFTDIIITKGISVELAFKLHEWEGSASKLRSKTGAVIDNGKIAYAHHMTVTLNEHDFDTYKRFYKWENVKISKFMVADKAPLPEWFTRVISHYYKLKAQLKASGKAGTPEYSLSKGVVNGLYGLSVQRVVFSKETLTDEGWSHSKLHFKNVAEQQEMHDIYEDTIGRSKKSMKISGGMPKVVLSPYYGVWCTSAARNRILSIIDAIGCDDFVYCDTDSVYYENAEKHQQLFDDWNAHIHAWNDENLIDEEFHTIGDFDPVELEDGSGILRYNFITLGAKRYLKFTEDMLHATVAGLPRGAFHRHAKEALFPGKHPDDITVEDNRAMIRWMVEHFQNGLKIASTEAMKNAHRYIDEHVEDTITDPEGNTETMSEESCIQIYPIEFTLKIDPQYEEIMGQSVEEFLLMKCYKQIREEDERF